MRSYEAVTKSIEQLNSPGRVVDTMRRAFASLKMGRPGPVMVEVPADVAEAEVDPSIIENYRNVKPTTSGADPDDVMDAARALRTGVFDDG